MRAPTRIINSDFSGKITTRKLSAASLARVSGFGFAVLCLLCNVQPCASALSVSLDSLTESVKGMMSDGFSQQEIINSIKSELSLSRVKGLLGKMYEGAELTDAEVERMRSGEVDDDDEELITILEKFGMDYLKLNQSAPYQDKLEDRPGEANDFMNFENELPSFHINEKQRKPDYAYSPYDLFRLVKAEELIYKPLKRYIRKVEEKLKILKSFTKDVEESSLLVTQSLGDTSNFEERAAAIVSNPLASYKLIKRFALKLPDVWKAVGEDYEEDLWSSLSNIQMKFQPPNDQDWKDSIEALLRIQYYNGYKAKQLANGILGSLKSGVSFSAQECMEIGLRAVALKQYDFALEWLHLAKKTLQSEKSGVSEMDEDILDQSVKYAINEHNKALQYYNAFGKSYFFTKKIEKLADIEVVEKMSSVIKDNSKRLRKVEEYNSHIPYNFISLCSGENLQTEEERSRLYCWLERSKSPYFYINPMKMELLSDDPPLIQIYNVINDKLINEVKQNAITKLQRSQVINYSDPTADDVSLLRTSSQTWMSSLEERNRLDGLAKLIEKLTGLKTRKPGSSEDFQVACYGTSHHYDEHLDAIQDPRRTSYFGERVATFMLYLSDVAEGGKTAFPVLGTAANAVKGSAVFWYNLKKNGDPDKRTWHGGCPVVHGIKWVMNNWILLYENIHNRQCGLRMDQ